MMKVIWVLLWMNSQNRPYIFDYYIFFVSFYIILTLFSGIIFLDIAVIHVYENNCIRSQQYGW